MKPRFQSQSPQMKKKYIDESWESYLAWAMNPRNQIYLDFDIFENKVKVNCKIIFFFINIDILNSKPNRLFDGPITTALNLMKIFVN